MSEQRLTTNQWAIIATINQEPDYRFVGNERRSADAMAKRGLLKPLPDRRYAVTAKGSKAFWRIA